MSISRALPADAHRVSALARETFPLACPPGTTRENIELFCDTKLSVEAFEGYFANPNICIWLATTEDEPVGYLMSVGGEPADPVIAGAVRMRPTVEISKIYVRECAHGSGIAQELMTMAEDYAREAGFKSVWLGVNQQNERAKRFYEKVGFQFVGERTFRVGRASEEDFILAKRLPPSSPEHFSEEKNRDPYNSTVATTTIELMNLAQELFPIPRSICGPAFRKSAALIGHFIPLNEHRVPSGSEIFDWVTPKEWNLKSARLVDPEGRVVVDSESNCLHVLNYSESFHGSMELEELQSHLYSRPENPDVVPYVTTYYEPRWGFCLAQNQRDSLKPGSYRVEIFTEKYDGHLSFFTSNLPAKEPTRRNVLLSTYLCHPSLGNNELSGPLAMVKVFGILQKRRNRVNYRFLIGPETIGSLAYLSREDPEWLRGLESGLVLTCLGGPETNLRIKLSRRNWLGDSAPIDEVARDFEQFDSSRFRTIEFDPSEGSDERQFCSPGFNLPVAQIARTVYGQYPEYHTSGDTLEYMDITAVEASADAIVELLKALEVAPLTASSTVQHGEPFLSPRKLFPSINVGGEVRDSDIARIRFGVLSLADGTRTVQQIWRKLELNPSAVVEQVDVLEEAGLLTLQMKDD